MLDNNNALKNLVLINNLIKSLETNNKEFLNQIDNRILNDIIERQDKEYIVIKIGEMIHIQLHYLGHHWIMKI